MSFKQIARVAKSEADRSHESGSAGMKAVMAQVDDAADIEKRIEKEQKEQENGPDKDNGMLYEFPDVFRRKIAKAGKAHGKV